MFGGNHEETSLLPRNPQSRQRQPRGAHVLDSSSPAAPTSGHRKANKACGCVFSAGQRAIRISAHSALLSMRLRWMPLRHPAAEA